MTVQTAPTASSGPATEELYHTNLIRIQAKQLLSESILPLSSQTGHLEEEVKWTKDVHDYLDVVQKTIRNIDAAVLSPDDVIFNKKSAGDNNINKKKGQDEEQKQQQKAFWIQLHSDKAKKHFEKVDDNVNDSENGNQHQWKIDFPGGEYLQTSCINSYAAHGAGLTTATANANVIPTLDLAVLLPVQSRNSDEEEDDRASGMIGGKDYLNGRYFDVR